MKTFLFIIFISFSSPLIAENCITKHIVDAIKFNQKRSRLYQKHYGNESNRLIEMLISKERLMLFYSIPKDIRARKYHHNGINVFCNDLSEIEDLPFETNKIIPHEYEIIESLPIKQISDLLISAIKNHTFEKIEQIAIAQLNIFEDKKSFCLTKHFIESIAKTASLTPKYIQAARAEKLKSPEKLIRSYLNNNVKGLKHMYQLDLKAVPLQKLGIPIFCQDIPIIELGSS